MGVLEHYPGMLKQNFYAAMLAMDLFSILPGVYKKSKVLLAALDLGDHVPQNCSIKVLIGFLPDLHFYSPLAT